MILTMFFLEYPINYFVFNVFYFFRRMGNKRGQSLNNAFAFLMLYLALFFLLFLRTMNNMPGVNSILMLVLYLSSVLVCAIIYKILLIHKKFLLGYKHKLNQFTFLEKQQKTNWVVLLLGGFAIIGWMFMV